MRIIIELQGGLVKNVFCPDWPDAEVSVVDWDALDALDPNDEDQAMSSTGPVDQWDDAHPVLIKIIEAVMDDSYLTVHQIREMLP